MLSQHLRTKVLMDISPFFVYMLPVFTLLALGALGSTRRLGFWPTVLLSIVLTPIGGFVATMISGQRKLKRATLGKPKAPSTEAAVK